MRDQLKAAIWDFHILAFLTGLNNVILRLQKIINKCMEMSWNWGVINHFD